MGHSFLFLYMCLYFWFENWTFESNEFVTRKQISPFYRVCSLLLFLFIFLFFWLLQSISVLKISLMCKLSLLRSFWACTLSWACSALSNFLPKREKKLNDGRAKGLRSFKSPGSYFSRRERDLKQWREMDYGSLSLFSEIRIRDWSTDPWHSDDCVLCTHLVTTSWTAAPVMVHSCLPLVWLFGDG